MHSHTSLDAAEAVSVVGLSRRFGSHRVLRNVFLEVGWGEAVAIVGRNGAGKSTLLRVLAGSLSPSRGSAAVAGWKAGSEGARAGTGFLAGDAYLYEDLTARENLIFALRMSGRTYDSGVVRGLLDRVGLVDSADRRVRFFSSGMRKRLALARVLALEASVLLLDEPYASLDREAGGLVDGIVRECRRGGGSVVMATHLRDRALRVCDRVVELHDGALWDDQVAFGPDVAPAPETFTGVA